MQQHEAAANQAISPVAMLYCSCFACLSLQTHLIYFSGKSPKTLIQENHVFLSFEKHYLQSGSSLRQFSLRNHARAPTMNRRAAIFVHVNRQFGRIKTRCLVQTSETFPCTSNKHRLNKESEKLFGAENDCFPQSLCPLSM